MSHLGSKTTQTYSVSATLKEDFRGWNNLQISLIYTHSTTEDHYFDSNKYEIRNEGTTTVK